MKRAPNLVERIEALIGPAIAAMGFDLVRVRFVSGGRPRLQIMAERPDGTMSVEDCAEVSHTVSAVLDVEDPIDGEYVLEVSSPGIDRPLVRPEDYERFSGFEAKLETAEPVEGRRRFRGRLAGCEGADVRIEVQGLGLVRLPFAGIAEGKLVLTDDLIRASLKQQADAAEAAAQETESSGASAARKSAR